MEFFLLMVTSRGVIPVSVGDQLGKLDPLVTIRLPSLKSPFLLPWPSVQVVQFRQAVNAGLWRGLKILLFRGLYLW